MPVQERSSSIVSQIIGLLEDQLDLLSLEWQYEKKQGCRRFVGIIIGFVLILTAFLFLQVALVRGLIALGGSLGWICVGLGGAYGALGLVIYGRFARRDPSVGEPFQASREELKRNLEWIQKLFS